MRTAEWHLADFDHVIEFQEEIPHIFWEAKTGLFLSLFPRAVGRSVSSCEFDASSSRVSPSRSAAGFLSLHAGVCSCEVEHTLPGAQGVVVLPG